MKKSGIDDNIHMKNRVLAALSFFGRMRANSNLIPNTTAATEAVEKIIPAIPQSSGLKYLVIIGVNNHPII